MHQALVKYCDITISQLIFDLKWVIESPGLLIESPPQINWELLRDDYFKICNEWLTDLKQNPGDLKAFFDIDHQFILGKYFEKLIQFIFEYFEGFKLVTNGLQVIKNNRTIGEIDFIFKNLMDNNPKDRLSVQLRDSIMLPLVIIQKFALQKMNDMISGLFNI